MSSLAFGIFTIKISQLLLFLCLAVALTIAQLVAWRRKVKILDVSLQIVLAAILVARLTFVVTWFGPYRSAPLSIFDIRDGGFHLNAGLVAGAALACWHAWRKPALRASLAAGTLAFLLAWLYVHPAVNALSSKVALPDAVVRTFDNQETTLQQLAQRKPMVVNLWASWCPPCRREMPMLVRASEQRKDLRFVFVNEDRNLGDALRFMQEENLPPGTTIADPDGALMRAFRAAALPTTLFFSADGKAVSIHVGALSDATLASELQNLHP